MARDWQLTEVMSRLEVSAPFVGPRELERRRGRPYRARLGANECLFGASPAAVEALQRCCDHVCLYNDPTNTELRNALARSWGLSRQHFVVAEGIEGLLGLFVRAFIEKGATAVTSLGAYPSFDYYMSGCDGALVRVPYRDNFAPDLDEIVAAARAHRARLVYLANPDNPTGAQLAASDLRQLIARLPAGCVLLLDEAYVEFARAAEVPGPTETWPNVVRLRTFSKAFGLAGARVGYAVCDPALVEALEGIRQHFAVSAMAQEMALAALNDGVFLDSVISRTREGRLEYEALALRLAARTLPSAANFVAFDFGTAVRATRVAHRLEANDVFVRHPAEPPLDRLVRVTVGAPADRDYLREVLLGAPLD